MSVKILSCSQFEPYNKKVFYIANFLRERKVHLHFKDAVKKCFNLMYLLSNGNSTCIQYKPKKVKTLKF